MKKKTISLILALILLLSCSATAQATSVQAATPSASITIKEKLSDCHSPLFHALIRSISLCAILLPCGIHFKPGFNWRLYAVSISWHGNHATRLYGRKGVDPHQMADCVRLLPVYNSSISCARYQCTRSASFPTHIACEMVAV